MRQASVALALLAGFASLLVKDAFAQGKPPMPFRVQVVYSPLYAIDLQTFVDDRDCAELIPSPIASQSHLVLISERTS